MKKSIFRWSFIAVISLICILVFTFSITTLQDNKDSFAKSSTFDTQRAYNNTVELAQKTRPRNSEAHAAALTYIQQQIASYGATPIVMEYNCTYQDAIKFGGYGGSSTLIPDTKVKNILVEFPGTESDDVFLIMAHTDSVPMGAGVYDDAVAVGVMMELIRQIKVNNLTFKNTVVFLFTDGEEEGLYGAQFFAEGRATINAVDSHYVNLINNVKFLTNWEARGTGGTLIMFEMTNGNYNSAKNFASINKKVYTNSIANFVYNTMPNGTDYSAFSNKGIQGLNFANIGEGYNYHTNNDDIANLDKSNIALFGSTMTDCLNHFASIDLNNMYNTEQNAVFFSWLNIFTVTYPAIIAIIFGVIALLLLVAGVIVNAKFKKYSIKQLCLALASNLIALVGAALTAFVLNFILGLIPSFTALLSSSSFSSNIAVMGYLFIMVGVYAVVMSLFNKLFKVAKSEYNMLAHCFFMAILGAVLSFAMPELSFLLACPGFIGAVAFAISLCVNKYEFSNYFLGAAPFIVMLPLGVSLTLLASGALGLTLGWITAIITLLAFCYVIPYLLNVRSYFNNLADNQTKISKPIEFAARKSNYLVSIVSFVLGITLLISGLCYPLSISTNVYGKASGRTMLFVDDTIVYRKQIDENTGKFVMYDQSAYEYLVNHYGIKSSFDNQVYTLDINGTVTVGTPTINATKKSDYYEIDIKKFSDGAFSLYFPLDSANQTAITKIEVTDANGTYIYNKEDFINKMTSSKQIKFRSWSNSVIKVYTSANTLDFKYVENFYYSFDIAQIKQMTDNEKYLLTGVELYKDYSI